MKLKIFSDRNYVPKNNGYEPILYPFWGKPSAEIKDWCGFYPWSECFDPYIEITDSLFEMSSLPEADLAIVPNNWDNWEEIQKPDPKILTEKNRLSIQFVEKVKQVEKPIIGFFGGDHSFYQLPIKCDLVFRQSLYQSIRTTADFAMPAWGEDFIKTQFNNELIIRKKQAKPVVGFCGFLSQKDWKTYVKDLFYQTQKLRNKPVVPKFNIGHALRLKSLVRLAKSSSIETNFIIREIPFFNLHDLQKQKPNRSVFMKNMLESDYIFCCRGAGSFSYRFYEALSCGRIPIFLNTDCVLPFDFEIDWRKYCVWVEEKEIDAIAEKVASFHENLSEQEFEDLQYECRKIWQERCSPEGFFTNIHKHFLKVF